MPPLSPIGYSVKTWSLSPYPTRFGQVEREPKPMLRIPSQWHCLMEVTARPGFHLFKTDPGYNDRVRPATETSRRRRAPSAGVRSSLDSPLEGDGFELPVPRELGLRRGRRLALHLGSLTLGGAGQIGTRPSGAGIRRGGRALPPNAVSRRRMNCEGSRTRGTGSSNPSPSSRQSVSLPQPLSM